MKCTVTIFSQPKPALRMYVEGLEHRFTPTVLIAEGSGTTIFRACNSAAAKLLITLYTSRFQIFYM